MNTFKRQGRTKRLNHLIAGLPISEELRESGKLIRRIKPFWDKWCGDHVFEYCELQTIRETTLTIRCPSSTSAMLIRHQRQSIIDTIYYRTKIVISNIVISIDKSPIENTTNTLKAAENFSKSPTIKPSRTTFESLQHCANTTQSEQLSNSLNALIATLNSQQNEPE